MSMPEKVIEIGRTTVDCFDPATGKKIGSSPVHTPEDARRAILRAKDAQHGWAALPLRERIGYVLRMRDYLIQHADEVSDVIHQDVGKTRIEALATEVLPTALAISYYTRQAERFLRPHPLGGGALLFFNKGSTLYRVPFGVVGIIAPWNYPLGIAMHEIVPALLAGNAVIFKIARETQMVGRRIEEMARAAGIPDGVFTYLNIPGAVVSDVLLDPSLHVDKLFFTGSVPVGKTLMAKAAESLTPVSLELGGNDAMLVCEDANLERAVNGAIWAGFQNSGQSCGAVERVYVHRDVYVPFMELLKERVEALRQGPDEAFDVDVGAMCTERQTKTVADHYEDALAKGATVFAQAEVTAESGNFFPATVLTDVNHDMLVMREESFGPLLGVMRVESMDEAVELANDSDLGLTGSVWSNNTKKAVALGRRIEAGVITINDHLMTHGIAQTPWGGFKESGIGRSHGQLGFEEMTEPQVVVTERLFFTTRNVWWHPYSEAVYKGLRGTTQLFYGNRIVDRVGGFVDFAKLSVRMFTK